MDYKYVSIEERKAKTKRSVEKLSAKKTLEPVVISGRKIAKSWWGIAWNENLESYADFSNRMSRGRSYIRNGSVIDLKIANGKINALVQGTRARPYKVEIKINPIPEKQWNEIIKECSGKIESLQELIEGNFPKELSMLFTEKGKGLFPAPKEIHFNCSCPDYASMCKHVAATLYGVGAKLDEAPQLFFVLRNVNIDDLIKKSIDEKSTSLLEKADQKSNRVLEDQILDVFGIDNE